ncbi:Putative auto-transporter adhesin, head GIN domain [Aquimarina amphilecti]|uniref:Putative auto-transporter adhesin, head GIN domain n=1 Tax=Aquimarina amphilecti TaxID=1038014 RepID=A0A1H7JX37_AQUAM|nr:head GIN domain-containing protein [Aquimarina amphilecti]SEK79271.1 Putative auto-transporter adhesin, head GIN domain [Aquimarina amphilecti]
MKKVIFLSLLFVVSMLNAQKVITKNVGDFNELKVFDKIEVKLIKGSENKVEVSGISRKEVDVVIKDNVLKIKMSLSNTWDNNDTKVIVYYTNIKKLDVNEGAKIMVKGALIGSELDLRAQEGGDIYAEIETEKLLARAVSGGGLHLEGKADEQEVTVKAGGQFIAEDLKTRSTQVKISAGGRANVNASDYVKANTAAGGTIRIYGNPKEVDGKKVFGGKIIEVN